MLTVRIQEKNYSESIMVLKLKDGARPFFFYKKVLLLSEKLAIIQFVGSI